MIRSILIITSFLLFSNLFAQEVMTPELLWELGRINPIGITKDGKSLVYSVKKYDVSKNAGETKEYLILGSSESDPSAGTISYQSPLGKALLHTQVGDTAKLQLDDKVVEYEVLKIN